MTTVAQCAICKDIITSSGTLQRCSCKAIAVDDGRYLAADLKNIIKVKSE